MTTTSSTDSSAKTDRCIYKRCHAAVPAKESKYAVAIIMRTKNRPLCLPRALASVHQQKFKNWQLVVVNDGGDENIVEAALKPFREIYADRLVVIHHPISLGMSEASNAAIRASSSEFIVVHDDDDSWHPDFLQEAVAFLRDTNNDDCCGVITQTVQVLEEIVDDKIIERERRDFNSAENPQTRVNLLRLLMQNNITTISYVFRRSVIDKIGYFNNLPVLDDWDFNIRCALHYEIGVIQKHLANYHHRITQQNSAYGNSIIATSNVCLQYETMIRNAGLRTLFNSEKHAELLGLCFAFGGYFLTSLQNQQQSLVWIDQKLRSPLAVDIANMQKQLATLQAKLDLLLQQQEMRNTALNAIPHENANA